MTRPRATKTEVIVAVNGVVQWSEAYCAEMNRTDPRVHCDEYCCEWTSPYGFVPEAGCPLHDVRGLS